MTRRERELLTLAPRDRYLQFHQDRPGLEGRIPQKDLARYLGVTPVGLNRIIGRLRREGRVAAVTRGRSDPRSRPA